MLSEETQRFLSDVHEEEECYETLSLCDLPLYSDQTTDDWEESSLGSTSISSTSSTNGNYFEFFSEELKTPENIVFCGKLIHNKKPEIIFVKKDSSESKQQTKAKKKFRLSFVKLTNMSILASSSSSSRKAKWYFMFFGSARISTEMEWKNVKSRKRSFNSSSSSSPTFKFRENDDDVVVEDGKGGWGLWRLIKELSCGGNTMAMVPK